MLQNEIYFVQNDHPVSVLTDTNKRLMETSVMDIKECDHPLIGISDGLDCSGCHRVYQQSTSHHNFSTKNNILFGFKILKALNNTDSILRMNPAPNFPFSICPVCVGCRKSRKLKIFNGLNH